MDCLACCECVLLKKGGGMISVLVADDHALVRAGIEAVLKDSHFHIVAAVASGEIKLFLL